MSRMLTVLATFLLGGAATPGTAPIKVAVSGVDGPQGRVYVAICTPDSFTHENCPYAAHAPAQRGTTIVTIKDVPPGTYAAQAYWDANGNGKADRNFAGLPTEPVGFSRNPEIGLSRPKFSGSSFVHNAKGSSLAITVRNIL